MNNEIGKNIKDMIEKDFYEIINSEGNNNTKDWLAKLGAEKINEIFDPSIIVERVIDAYRKMGYSEEWVTNKFLSILKEKKESK